MSFGSSNRKPSRPAFPGGGPRRPPTNRPPYPNRPGHYTRGPQRFRRPVRPMMGYGRGRPPMMRRSPYQQDSICRIVRQILIANPSLAGPIQEALMRHGIHCPGLQGRGGGYGGGGPKGGGMGDRGKGMTAQSNYGCTCNQNQVLPAFDELVG